MPTEYTNSFILPRMKLLFCDGKLFINPVYDERSEYIKEIDHELYRRVFEVFNWEQVVSGEIYNYRMCNDCGSIFDKDDEEMIEVNGNFICESCFEDDYMMCAHCGSAHHNDDMIYIKDKDQYVCDDCAGRHYSKCGCCDEWYSNDGIISDGDVGYCESCFERHYFRCDSCGYIYHNIDGYSNGVGLYCEICFENERDGPDHYGIFDYDYVPVFNPRGTGILHFGVELEVDHGDIHEFKFEELSDTFYCKHDGSLDEGFEIVSHPMTYDWIMENSPFKNPITLAKAAHFKSNDTNTCGLHVHMSRKAFGKGAAQDDRITSFIYFFEKFWPEIVKFSRRRGDSIEHYCKRFLNEDEIDEIPNPLPMKVVDDTKKKFRYERYMCVNITNRDTVEVRIFKGSLKENTVIASIQLCKLFYELSVFDVNVIENMTWDEIKKYTANDYPELLEAFKERGV